MTPSPGVERMWDTSVEGERSHHCANPALLHFESAWPMAQFLLRESTLYCVQRDRYFELQSERHLETHYCLPVKSIII